MGSVLLIALAFLLWRLFYVHTKSTDESALTDGAVLMLADGMVQQASNAARTLFGTCENLPVIRVLENFLGADSAEARDAVNRLEMTGERLDMLVYTPDGRPFEMIGKPAGALIRLVFRDARLLDDKLRDAQQRVEAADTALNTHEWAQETLRGLIEEGPIIAWHRAADGEIDWSGGEIKARAGSVNAEQAVDLIVARTKLNRQPILAGQPQKSRIEIVVNEGMETVSLHVIEILRQDGSRIGFATDAGTATSAERTLTRFVQTMTETFAHLTVGLAIFDRNQTLALFNPALVTMWQVEPAWLARRPSLRDIIDELRATRRLPELQDFHKWRTRLIDLFENTEAADYEELWHLADGSNIRVLARPHPHGSLAFIFDDVTERMRLEQRYRHSIDLRRSTLDRLSEGVAVFGANGLLQFVNLAFHEIWGTDTESVYAAMHARQLVSMCQKMTVETDVWHRLHGYITGEENRRAWTAQLTMDSRRILTARFAPLPDGSTMAVFADITQTERVAQQLGNRTAVLGLMDTMREAVVARLNDRLAQPLAALADQSGTNGAAMPPGSAAEMLADVQALTRMISSATFGHGSRELPFELSELVVFTTWLLHDRANERGVDLQHDAPWEDGQVIDDPQRLRLMAFAMVTDSLKHAVRGSIMTIAAMTENDATRLDLTLTVDDNDLQLPVIASPFQGDVTLDLPQVERLMITQTAMIEITRLDHDRVQVSCRFGPPDLHEETPGLPAPVDGKPDSASAAGFSGNVHPLKPRSSN